MVRAGGGVDRRSLIILTSAMGRMIDDIGCRMTVRAVAHVQGRQGDDGGTTHLFLSDHAGQGLGDGLSCLDLRDRPCLLEHPVFYYCLGSNIKKCAEVSNRLNLKRTRGLGLSPNPLVLLGGAGEDRTRGLLNAIQALSQLSYNPTCFAFAEEVSS